MQHVQRPIEQLAEACTQSERVYVPRIEFTEHQRANGHTHTSSVSQNMNGARAIGDRVVTLTRQDPTSTVLMSTCPTARTDVEVVLAAERSATLAKGDASFEEGTVRIFSRKMQSRMLSALPCLMSK